MLDQLGKGSVASSEVRSGTPRQAGGRVDGKGQDKLFKGRHFTSEVILWTLWWYLAFPVSYRDLAAILADRGFVVDHSTLFHWVQAYSVALEQRIRRHLRPCNGSWRVV